jgi:hypothetical protein
MKLATTGIFLLSLIFFSRSSYAQSSRADKLYSMSGIGFAMPVGESADFFKPKFSTTLGLNLALGNGGLFLYPQFSLHAYKFNQIDADTGYPYTLQEGRASTYLLNVALGYRKFVNKWAFYGYGGAGGGFILTPQAGVDINNQKVTLNNKTNGTGIVEAGIGAEYNLGGVSLFLETSYMQGLSKIQNRNFSTVPITFGIKPNLSKLIRKR